MAYIGIDFGTSFTTLTQIDATTLQPEVVNKVPSIIGQSTLGGSSSNQLIICGADALNQMAINPTNTIYDIKRWLGRNLSDELFDSERFAFNLVMVNREVIVQFNESNELDGNGVNVGGGGQVYSVRELLRELFIKLLVGVNLIEVLQVTMTFSDGWDDAKIRVIKEAFGQFQLNERLSMISEANATIYSSYYFDPVSATKLADTNQLGLIVDLGGGKLEMTLYKVSQGSPDNAEITIVNQYTDETLGGRSFDQALTQYCLGLIYQQSTIDLLSLPDSNKSITRLHQACEHAKCQLTTCNKVRITLDYLLNNVDATESANDDYVFDTVVTRTMFDGLCTGLLFRLGRGLDKVLANTKLNRVGLVNLVGGGCRVPRVVNFFKEKFSSSARTLVKVNWEYVSLGACIYSYKNKVALPTIIGLLTSVTKPTPSPFIKERLIPEGTPKPIPWIKITPPTPSFDDNFTGFLMVPQQPLFPPVGYISPMLKQPPPQTSPPQPDPVIEPTSYQQVVTLEPKSVSEVQVEVTPESVPLPHELAENTFQPEMTPLPDESNEVSFQPEYTPLPDEAKDRSFSPEFSPLPDEFTESCFNPEETPLPDESTEQSFLPRFVPLPDETSETTFFPENVPLPNDSKADFPLFYPIEIIQINTQGSSTPIYLDSDLYSPSSEDTVSHPSSRFSSSTTSSLSSPSESSDYITTNTSPTVYSEKDNQLLERIEELDEEEESYSADEKLARVKSVSSSLVGIVEDKVSIYSASSIDTPRSPSPSTVSEYSESPLTSDDEQTKKRRNPTRETDNVELPSPPLSPLQQITKLYNLPDLLVQDDDELQDNSKSEKLPGGKKLTIIVPNPQVPSITVQSPSPKNSSDEDSDQYDYEEEEEEEEEEVTSGVSDEGVNGEVETCAWKESDTAEPPLIYSPINIGLTDLPSSTSPDAAYNRMLPSEEDLMRSKSMSRVLTN